MKFREKHYRSKTLVEETTQSDKNEKLDKLILLEE